MEKIYTPVIETFSTFQEVVHRKNELKAMDAADIYIDWVHNTISYKICVEDFV